VFVADRSMATGTQPALDSTAKRLSHGDRVELNVNSENLLSEPDEIFGSWRRCLLDYRVDARNFLAPHVITQTELKDFREPMENLLAQSQEEIAR
jgi:transcriptional regulator of acetoin/glycerol metabolism